MPLLTEYKGGRVHHILPTGGERRSDGRLTPAGFVGAALCGTDPGEVAHEINGRTADNSTAMAVCKACVSQSTLLSAT